MKLEENSLSDYIKKWKTVHGLISLVESYEGARITFCDDYYTIFTHDRKDFHSIEDGLNYMKKYGRDHKTKYKIEEEKRIERFERQSVFDKDPIEEWARMQKQPTKEPTKKEESRNTLADAYRREHPFLASIGLERIVPLGVGF